MDVTNVTTDDFSTKVQGIVQDYLKSSAFSDRKVTDTPTDALQVVNKKYADSVWGAVFPAPGTSGNELISNGSIWTSGTATSINGKMYLNSTQSIPGSVTKVLLDTTSFANGITADTTNNQFVILTAGVYAVYGKLNYLSPTNGSLYDVFLGVNGVTNTFYQALAGTASQIDTAVYNIFTLAVNDVIAVYGFANNKNLGTGVDVSYLTIEKI